MKLSGFKCDRCGMNFDKNTTKNSEGHTLVGMAIVDLKLHLDRYDLCDRCMESLFDWFNKPENK